MNNKFIDQMMTSNEHKVLDVIRFCRSDKVMRRIDCVVDDRSSPSAYASFITEKQWKSFFDRFGKEQFEEHDEIPDDIKIGWVFDRILENALIVRIAKMRPKAFKDITALLYTAYPYFLTVNHGFINHDQYCGLSHFKTHCSAVLESVYLDCNQNYDGLIKRLVSSIGDIYDESWIFRKKNWYAACSGKPDLLKYLRGFLYISVISHMAGEEFVESNFDVPHSYLMTQVEYFIELLECPETTPRDIKTFIGSIENYSDEIPIHRFLQTLIHLPFSAFEHGHRAVFKNRYDPLPSSERYDTPIWNLMKELGEEYDPDLVVETDCTPWDLTDYVVKNHCKEIYSGPIRNSFKNRGTVLPENFPKYGSWMKGMVFDQVYCALILKRWCHLTEASPVKLTDAVVSRSHIMLVIEDGDHERTGLSLVGDLILYNMSKNIDHISEREHHLLCNLYAAWEKLNFLKSNKMPKIWKKVLSSKENRSRLRSLMFTIIESINIKGDFKDYLPFDREGFFQFVDNTTEYLTGQHEVEEIEEFLETMPMLGRTVVLSNWDQCLWTVPFDQVPPIGDDED